MSSPLASNHYPHSCLQCAEAPNHQQSCLHPPTPTQQQLLTTMAGTIADQQQVLQCLYPLRMNNHASPGLPTWLASNHVVPWLYPLLLWNCQAPWFNCGPITTHNHACRYCWPKTTNSVAVSTDGQRPATTMVVFIVGQQQFIPLLCSLLASDHQPP